MNNLKQLLYILQLEEYDNGRFSLWIKSNSDKEIKENKNQLVWTVKARIIYLISLVINYLTFKKFPEKSIMLANSLTIIPQLIIKEFIILLATIKIWLRNDLTVIGITGSYGKTSTKEILSHILSAKYKVLKTPDSYNTPLGISRTILKNLKPEHQILIVEMGAYQKGDIKKLCNIVHPEIGIITAIGLSHLERFGSEKNIAQTKFELVDSLPKNGMAFLNLEDKIIYEYAKKYPKQLITYYGFNKYSLPETKRQQGNSLIAGEIETSLNGTSFKLYRHKEISYEISTPLLGTHNVLNTLVAISVSYFLGMKLVDIAKQCSTIKVIPHRLQILKGDNNTTIIDDSFNSNPDSFRSALKVLSEIPAKRKIIITPGVIELGERQDEENKLMGEEMVKTADYIIVVGETNRKALTDGIELGIRNYELRVETSHGASLQYFIVKDLNEATEKLKEFVIPGSVILFENDLPDQYR